jgi:hypothetical protein
MAALDVSLQMARQDAYVADRCQDSEHDEHEQHWRAPSHRSSKVHALLRACQRAYRYRDWVRLVSGNGVDHTRRFRDIAAANSKLSARSIVLDGEVAIYDQQLRSRFDGLSESAPDARRLPADRHQAELMRIEHRAVAVYWGPLSLSH